MVFDGTCAEEQYIYIPFLISSINNNSDAKAQSRLSGSLVHADAFALADNKHCRCVFELQIPFSGGFRWSHE